MLKNIITALVFIFALGCDQTQTNNQVKSVSASACVKTSSEGSIADCEVDHSSDDTLNLLSEIYQQIDVDAPGPLGPEARKIDKESLSEVVAINPDNTLVLDSGVEIKLAGVDCHSSELNYYLSQTLINESSETLVAIKQTGFVVNNQFHAYVWDLSWFNDYPQYGPSIGALNETLITSGYCEPVEQPEHLYHERYKKLAQLAEKISGKKQSS